MADLSPPHPPPPQQPSSTNFAIDSDDISSLLHTLLQSSSQQQPQQQPPPRQFPGSSGFADSPGLLDPNFPYSGAYYGSADGVDDGDCHSEDETRGKSASGRTSSKRSRAAEVHNMSEKRRRHRINEKMKALQKLIPNSNKTDKASMLDEAIEYLKQLQLQVQMLTMRNGSSSHPFYLPPVVQPPCVGPLDEANSRVGSFTADQEASMQAMLNLSNKPVSSDYKLLMARMSENNNSGQACVPESSMTLQYRPYNASMPSKKALCKDPALPQLQLDMSQYGQSSSSGVSS